MPTANRRKFVPLAITYFLAQDYPQKELLILDDGEDCVADLIPKDERIHYVRESRRSTVGSKRNVLCEMAQSEIIIHWDDDDWYSPQRLKRQVTALQKSGADITGLDRVFFLSEDLHAAWEYVYPRNSRPWVCGASLCYSKTFWRTNPFRETQIGEDACFVWTDRNPRLAVVSGNDFLVALIHSSNTSPKHTHPPLWLSCSPNVIAALMGADWLNYSGAACSAPTVHSSKTTKIGPRGRSLTSTMEDAPKITIGIHVTDDGERLLATCAAIEANTSVQVEVLLLVDGANERTEAAIAELTGFQHVGFVSRRGAPACFNLLAREGQGNVLIFMESGTLPGPGWLESICLALSQDPSNGLAGPSTNRSWNMQCVFQDATAANISATSRTAQTRFANSVRTMEPLYCLADFCYAVKREVIQAIGAADEAYGEGPCWEMDYSVRAARAGWRPVWAQSAYVYRMPLTSQRVQREKDNFDAGRHHYQDKFCARQLRGNSGGYNQHCRGEQCSNFAPRGKIPIFIPLHEDQRQQKVSVDVPPKQI
jgi:GT2 family glycosyltransferase